MKTTAAYITMAFISVALSIAYFHKETTFDIACGVACAILTGFCLLMAFIPDAPETHTYLISFEYPKKGITTKSTIEYTTAKPMTALDMCTDALNQRFEQSDTIYITLFTKLS